MWLSQPDGSESQEFLLEWSTVSFSRVEEWGVEVLEEGAVLEEGGAGGQGEGLEEGAGGQVHIVHNIGGQAGYHR